MISRDRSQRRAALLLLGFVLALLVGVFGHPFADLPGHVCDEGAAHLEGHPDHQHDGRTCAACHLFQGLASADAPAPRLELPAPTVAPSASPAEASLTLPREALFSFDSRGPPTV